jgi:hypothetical protein
MGEWGGASALWNVKELGEKFSKLISGERRANGHDTNLRDI